ncbi:MAG: dihydrodipicolinate synthase family protein [Bryobacteraceae bacterium]|nr:dihydrodipicolinate synthase family protein [Bryobacteraceae bacterium]MDW8377883.1 dihydrodipicolinate synthase family protein [Bryobacterales bacterium]
MRTSPVQLADWRGVFPVPPLARKAGASRSLDFDENNKLLRYLEAGGMTRFLYGGNAFLYHLPLAEYEALLDWLNSQPDHYWCIPSAGPSFGRLMDQAPLLRRYRFPAVMHLPCGDPRDAQGLEAGLREFNQASGTPLILYLKEENNFGADLEAGLDAVARLVRDGVCIGIKYAVVRKDPETDPYLESLLKRVDRRIVLSGIGERPALAHLQKFGLPGFTTGSGCLAPSLSNRLLEACQAGEEQTAQEIRQRFLPHEDLRDAWGPARVLHASVALAGICETGPIPPFVTGLHAQQLQQLEPVVKALAEQPVAA